MTKITKAREISKGKCAICEEIIAKNGMTKHLQTHRKEKVSSDGKSTKFFHIVFEGRYAPEYWLHLQVPKNITLEDIHSVN